MWGEWGFGIPLKDWRRREQGDSGCLYTAAGVVQAGRMRSNLGNTFCFAKQVLWKLGFSVTLRPQFSYFRWMSKLLDNYDGMGSGAGRWKGDSLLPPSTYREQRLFSQVPSPHLLLLHWFWYPPHTSSAVDIVSGYTTCIWWRRALSPCDCMTKWTWQNPSCDGQLWMQDHLMSLNQMLCVSQGSTEQWLLVFEWAKTIVTDGVGFLRSPRGLSWDSSWGFCHKLHTVSRPAIDALNTMEAIAPQPATAAEPFCALGPTESWQSSLSLSKWVRAMSSSVEHVVSSTWKGLLGCGKQTQRWSPSDPRPQHSLPCVLSSTGIWSRPCGLLLTHRKWQIWWDGPSKISLQRGCRFCLGRPSGSLSVSVSDHQLLCCKDIQDTWQGPKAYLQLQEWA